MLKECHSRAEAKQFEDYYIEKNGGIESNKVYNILGDYPDVIAKYLVSKMVQNDKNNVRFTWLTNAKAFKRFIKTGYH